MRFSNIKQYAKVYFKRNFAMVLLLATSISICNYIIYKPVEKITSLFYKRGSNTDLSLSSTIRDVENVSAFTVLGLVIIGIGLTIWKRKYFWYLLVALITAFFMNYLDTEAFYLPN